MILEIPNSFHRDPRMMHVTTTQVTLDGTTTRLAMVCRASQTGSISTLGFYVRNYSSSQTVKASVQTITSNATPSGTLWATNTSGTNTPSTGGTFTFTLTAAAAVTEGQMFAVVLEWNSTAGSINFASNENFALPIYQTYASSTWTKQSNLWISLLIGYSDGSYPPRMALCTAQATANLLSTSASAKEGALKFKPALNYRLIGFYHYGYLIDCTYKLYDASNNVLQTQSLPANSPTDTTDRMLFFPFTPYQLVAGSTYRIGLVPNGTTNSKTYQIVIPSNTQEHLGMGSADCYSGRGTVGGGWTDPVNLISSIIPVYDAVAIGSGGLWNGGING